MNLASANEKNKKNRKTEAKRYLTNCVNPQNLRIKIKNKIRVICEICG
jgi:hypothetical protein